MSQATEVILSVSPNKNVGKNDAGACLLCERILIRAQSIL